jgi:hypothetical protein
VCHFADWHRAPGAVVRPYYSTLDILHLSRKGTQ